MIDPVFLLDSNICIYLLNNFSPELAARVGDQPAGSLCMSSITLAKIAVGYGHAIDDAPNLRAMIEQIPVLDFDEAAARVYGTLPFRRSRFDRLIAAHALSLNMALITNNEADFADIPGLRTENWTL